MKLPQLSAVKTFVEKYSTYIILALIVLIFIITLSLKEGFSEFPGVFKTAEFPFVKELSLGNMFNTSKTVVMPVEVPSMFSKFPIELPNGLAVSAPINIPYQIAQVPTDQMPVMMPEPVKTDSIVPAQDVMIGAQTVSIPGKVDEAGNVISIPVTVPAQIVSVPEQKAYVPVTETFKMV